MVTLSLLVALCYAAAPIKIAVAPIAAGEAVTDKTAAAITDAIAREVRRVPGVQAIAPDEMKSFLDLDRQRRLASCEDQGCMAELGGALGVDRIVSGRLNKIGETWVFALKMLDVKKASVLSQTDRQLRNKSLDDVLDQVSPMVAELLSARPATGPIPAPAPQPEPAPVAASAAPPRLPPNWADVPLSPPPSVEGLKIASDENGHFIAFSKKSEAGRFFWGDGTTFWKVPIRGTSGNASYVEYHFWDPRLGSSGGAFQLRDGKASLTCGPDHRGVLLKILPGAEAKETLAKARLLESRWRRRALALARDDAGTYYFVDRVDEPRGDPDFHLYVGTKGKMQPLALTDRIGDEKAEIFVSAQGRLKHAADGTAEWVAGTARTPLVWLEITHEAQLIYTTLGIYSGQQLGTPCDVFF
jgi:hypothetical protein